MKRPSLNAAVFIALDKVLGHAFVFCWFGPPQPQESTAQPPAAQLDPSRMSPPTAWLAKLFGARGGVLKGQALRRLALAVRP
jgi:hypothetical protein